MKRRLFLLVIAGLAAGSARAAAQTLSKPSVTVVAFTADRGAKLSSEQGAAIADELARQLVEGGRYRVLQREWLPAPRGSVDDLRKAAASADVEYLVIGTVSQSRRAVPQNFRPVALEQAGFGVRVPGFGRRPIGGRGIPPPPRRVERPMVTLDLRVVDVASGEIVRRAGAQHWVDGSAPSPTTVVAGLVGGPAGAVLAVATHRGASPDKLDKLDRGMQQSIEGVARTLSSSAAQLARD